MDKRKVIKIGGAVLSIVGAILSIANSKLDDMKLKEEVAKEVKEALSKETDEETE